MPATLTPRAAPTQGRMALRGRRRRISPYQMPSLPSIFHKIQAAHRAAVPESARITSSLWSSTKSMRLPRSIHRMAKAHSTATDAPRKINSGLRTCQRILT